MEILLQDLLPGQEYLLQLRSKNQQGVSQWSRAYSITTDSDVTPPSPITGLSWVVSRASFIAEWTAPTTDSDGDPLRDFKDFKVSLTADGQTVIFYVTEERFDFSIERNIASFGSPESTVEIKVEVRDTIGNLSTPVTSSVSNPIPSDVTGFDATSALGGINFVWNHVSDDDLKTYEIYGSSSAAFTPSPANLRATTSENQLFYATSDSTVQYFKIRALDLFDQGSANYTLESGQAYPIDGIPDAIAPSQPSAPTISLGTLVAQVSHDMTKQGGGSLESDVDYLEVHASVTTGFTPSSSTLRGTIDSAGLGIPVSSAFFFPSTDSMTNLYWKIIAVDRSKNKSVASNQATGLPGLIENINILNATITDAKIQNLSAAKLIAGTAIINDLFIESGLTVSATGFIESDNFVSGTSGWKINADGTVEFNDGTFRGDVLIQGDVTTMLLTINENDVPVFEITGPDGGLIRILLDVLDNPSIVLRGAAGESYEMEINDDYFTINFTNLSGEPAFFIKNNYGIYFRSGGTSKTVVFDEATGYLRSGFGTTMYTWTDATLQNGWTSWGAGHANVGYLRDPMGYVVLRGVGRAGTLTDGTTIFTLPTGYRPSFISQHHVYGTSGAIINIQSDGQVKIYAMPGVAGSPLALDGIRFPTI